jgi:hypothetical protein
MFTQLVQESYPELLNKYQLIGNTSRSRYVADRKAILKLIFPVKCLYTETGTIMRVVCDETTAYRIL